MAIKPLPNRGRIARVQELKRIITNASLLVHEISSMQRFVLPLLSNDVQSSGFTKSNSFIAIDREVSKLLNIA